MENIITTPQIKSKKTRREYHETFKHKNADKIKEKQTCELCGGHYQYFNKSHHVKSKKHIFVLIQNEINQLKKSNSN